MKCSTLQVSFHFLTLIYCLQWRVRGSDYPENPPSHFLTGGTCARTKCLVLVNWDMCMCVNVRVYTDINTCTYACLYILCIYICISYVISQKKKKLTKREKGYSFNICQGPVISLGINGPSLLLFSTRQKQMTSAMSSVFYLWNWCLWLSVLRIPTLWVIYRGN